MVRLREVVSVVSQFSEVSKVNTLSNKQVCKCFHYNTGIFLSSSQSMRAAGERASKPSGSSNSHSPPLVPGFWGLWQHKSTSHWGLGLHFVGQWTTAEAAMPCHSEVVPLTPPPSSHFSWYQQTERRNTMESTGEFLCTTYIQCTYCFPSFHWLSKDS